MTATAPSTADQPTAGRSSATADAATADAATADAAAAEAGNAGVSPAEVSAAEAAAQIGVLREKIDAVDDGIIRLINERRALSHDVGRLRAAVGGPRLSITREHQIMGKFARELGAYGSQVALLLLKISRGRM